MRPICPFEKDIRSSLFYPYNRFKVMILSKEYFIWAYVPLVGMKHNIFSFLAPSQYVGRSGLEHDLFLEVLDSIHLSQSDQSDQFPWTKEKISSLINIQNLKFIKTKITPGLDWYYMIVNIVLLGHWRSREQSVTFSWGFPQNIGLSRGTTCVDAPSTHVRLLFCIPFDPHVTEHVSTFSHSLYGPRSHNAIHCEQIGP